MQSRRGDDNCLPPWTSVLVVVAHPDDESFGLGGIIAAFVDAGADVAVLCLTRGETSTVSDVAGDLAAIRAAELAGAAQVLGVSTVRLMDYPDGGLAGIGLTQLSDHVVSLARQFGTEGLLVFDSNGITGHPDHVRATAAAVFAAPLVGIDVLAWTLSQDVAHALRAEVGAELRGRPATEIDIVIDVDRTLQVAAVGRHPSQVAPGSALWRRLELQESRECLRWLVHSPAAAVY